MHSQCLLCISSNSSFLIITVIVCFHFIPSLTAALDGSEEFRKFDIVEELPANSFVCNLVTELGLDTKYEPYVLERLRFGFFTQPTFDRTYFSIDERTGVIRTTRRIDREQACPSGSSASQRAVGLGIGCIAQFDISIQPIAYFQIVKVQIHILDINDNAPKFPIQHINHRIAESSDPESGGIIIPAAVDYDAGRNAVRKYEIISGSDKFLLESRQTADGGTDVRLLLRQPLDREIEDSYEITVVATDGGDPPKSGSLIVNITVIDVNDNSPIFDNSTYEVHVPENSAPGTIVTRVHAHDPDLDLNGVILYSFLPVTVQRHGHIFGIKPESGKIYLKTSSLDRETAPVHLLSVAAVDRGPDPLPVHATVIVHVDDVNDNAPVIHINTLTSNGQAEVPENSASATFVAYVAVNDADKGINGQFQCGITGISGSFFALHQQAFATNEYQLVTTVAFDRELHDSHDVVVTCFDSGSPSLTSSSIVRVHVLDTNDNSPQFSSLVYDFEIYENCPVGTLVGTVAAADNDYGSSGEIEYQLHVPASVTASKLVHIHPHTGNIFTCSEVDRETLYATQEIPIIFNISATDHGPELRSSVALVRISVKDVDDEPPRFDAEHYVFEVPENQPAGILVGSVHVIDNDLPPHNHVIYLIATGINEHISTSAQFDFDIDAETGNVTTHESLDRERIAKYHFSIAVRSVMALANFPAFSATAKVTIHVTDINDHRPVFTNPLWNNQTVGVSSQSPVNFVVIHLCAVDLDAGQNAQLTFRLLGGNRHNAFALDPKSGTLTVAADLSNVIFDDFMLQFSVADGGYPSFQAITELRIVVSRDIALPTSTVDPSVNTYGGMLASENVAVILAATLAAILTAIGAVALMICVIRWRSHSRRIFRLSSETDNAPKTFTPGSDNKLLVAVWGSPGYSSVESSRTNGRIRPLPDFIDASKHTETSMPNQFRLHQQSSRPNATADAECNGNLTISAVIPVYTERQLTTLSLDSQQNLDVCNKFQVNGHG